ncbi:hypothetical protein COT83_05700 [Candidatus Peregrinibacteria bacterium CG10_big_fil_rev_8_21_14_0_10_44_7]|nr:MAG: hypothetical protein AUK45_03185 [Candidatus Peregrinibacteria bacterium CG2_30_44_17]PIS03497.1 MAG: hypothetical protein COT83_05700 [Candidatus Peregrinibacteria bacterium CG10_big_fil_rev_8_21_14_0_10_44_7]PJB89074.1 MAG: hypothetical protein CO082_02325 [Candidatus Peregrinibacteria bacterium CG_4_9_14_0_8_um_filter_44_15]
MAKKFLLAFLAIMLYMAIWAVILYAGIEISGGDEAVILPLAGGVFVFYLPYFFWVTPFVFKFKSEVKPPISVEELRSKLLNINNLDVPVMAEEKKSKIIITWKYLDAKWWEILRKSGITSVYQLVIKLDEKKHRAKLIDINKTVSWGVGPTGVKLRGGYFRGVMFQIEVGKSWGITENFGLGKIYDYKFSPSEIKNPVMNEILKSGWDVVFAIY